MDRRCRRRDAEIGSVSAVGKALKLGLLWREIIAAHGIAFRNGFS